ncbi:Uncharacterised protein [Mycobacteroides abscessus subsp. abscessus]|nr:Uncharacterised protein [Mycobacteroides abscessus subsp. abscessus]
MLDHLGFPRPSARGRRDRRDPAPRIIDDPVRTRAALPGLRTTLFNTGARTLIGTRSRIQRPHRSSSLIPIPRTSTALPLLLRIGSTTTDELARIIQTRRRREPPTNGGRTKQRPALPQSPTRLGDITIQRHINRTVKTHPTKRPPPTPKNFPGTTKRLVTR